MQDLTPAALVAPHPLPRPGAVVVGLGGEVIGRACRPEVTPEHLATPRGIVRPPERIAAGEQERDRGEHQDPRPAAERDEHEGDDQDGTGDDDEPHGADHPTAGSPRLDPPWGHAAAGATTPRSVTSALTSSAGVMSKAGLRTGVSGRVISRPP